MWYVIASPGWPAQRAIREPGRCHLAGSQVEAINDKANPGWALPERVGKTGITNGLEWRCAAWETARGTRGRQESAWDSRW